MAKEYNVNNYSGDSLGDEKMLDILRKRKEKKEDKTQRKIRVRFPSMAGDENRSMTMQELEEYKDYLIIDPRFGKQIDLEKLANLEIDEIVIMPPIAGG